MPNRPIPYFLPAYLSLLRSFRNGVDLISAHHRRRDLSRAVFWDGRQIRGVPGRAGLADTVLEIWGLREYTHGGFYRPRDGDVVIDIGANVGIFSMWVARHAAHANVYAFEPMSENCEAMRGNLHGWSHHVRLCQAAVGRRSGHGQMARRPDRTLDHRLLESSTAATDHEEVEVLTLAQAVDVASAPAIDFLKMDIEGGEVDALEGADRSLLSRIRRVALEFHDNIRPGALSRVKDLLSRTHRIVDVHGDAYGILRAEVL